MLISKAPITVLVLLSLLCWATGTPLAAISEPPVAQEGLLDLSGWDFADGHVRLSGEFEFYWLEHYGPQDFASGYTPRPDAYLTVPAAWNCTETINPIFPPDGYATYRLTVFLRDSVSGLALKFTDMASAYKVFVNGKEALAVGKAGKTKATTEPRYSPQVLDLEPLPSKVEIIVHVSNFHQAFAGIREPIELGRQSDLHDLRERKVVFDLVLVGCILVMGIYQVGFFMLRRRDRFSLYFTFFCILVALRTLTTAEVYLLSLFPALPWEALMKIVYLSFYLAVPTFSMLLYYLFPEESNLFVLKSIGTIGIATALFVVLTPARVYSETVIAYQIYTILCLCYGLYVLLLGIVRKREGAVLFLVGFLALFAAIVNDILFFNKLIATGYVLHLGFMFFMFTQAFILYYRFAQAFRTVAVQKEELALTSEKYRTELAERKRTQKRNTQLRERLEEAARMETLGRLASTVAHDLNNILSCAVTYPDYLLNRRETSDGMRTPLQTIRDSGLRASAVVQDLLLLSGRGMGDAQPLNLNQMIEAYLKSTEYHELQAAHPNIVIESMLDAWLGNIKGSQIHLARVVMNLMCNAAEAQPDGGRILISTNKVRIDAVMHAYEDVPPGEYAVLQVDDSGLGIADENLRKIFQPFYTRKVMGRGGTGLGMVVVWGTVHDHKGFIDVKSMVGVGTTVSLYFPTTTEEIPAPAYKRPLDSYRGHNETIFVVDDRKEQREIASKVLTDLGYQVKTFSSGEEAVDDLSAGQVDLVMLDMMMENGIDGLETYRRILQRQPHTKAIVSSGLSETEEVKLVRELGAGAYLQKPYTLEEIGLAVRTELDK